MTATTTGSASEAGPGHLPPQNAPWYRRLMGWGPVPVPRRLVRFFGVADLAQAVVFGGITAMLAYFAFFSRSSGDEWVLPAAFGLCSTVLIGVTAVMLLRERYNRPVTTTLVWSAAGLVVASVVTFAVLVGIRGVDGGVVGMLPLIFSAAAFGAARWARSWFQVPVPPRPYRSAPTGPRPPPGTPPVGPPPPPPGSPSFGPPPPGTAPTVSSQGAGDHGSAGGVS